MVQQDKPAILVEKLGPFAPLVSCSNRHEATGRPGEYIVTETATGFEQIYCRQCADMVLGRLGLTVEYLVQATDRWKAGVTKARSGPLSSGPGEAPDGVGGV